MCAFKIRPIAIDPAPEWDAPWLFNRRMGINTPDPAAALEVRSSGSVTGLICRSVVLNQAGHLQSWQNSLGGILGQFEADGDLRLNTGSFSVGSPANIARIGAMAQTATDVPMAARGTVSQSGDLQRWENVSGTILARVLSDGDIRLHSGTLHFGNDSNAYIDRWNSTLRTLTKIVTPVAGNNTADFLYVPSGVTGANMDAKFIAAYKFYPDGYGFVGHHVTLYHVPAASVGTTQGGELSAYWADVFNYNPATISHLIGVAARVGGVSGSITIGTHFRSLAPYLSVGSGTMGLFKAFCQEAFTLSSQNRLQTAIGVQIQQMAAVDAYGVYIYQQNGAARRQFGLYSEGPWDYHGGNVRIGEATGTVGRLAIVPTGTAQVGVVIKGLASQTGDLTQWMTSSSAVLAAVHENGGLTLNTAAGVEPTSGNMGPGTLNAAVGVFVNGVGLLCDVGLIDNVTALGGITDLAVTGRQQARAAITGSVGFIEASSIADRIPFASGTFYDDEFVGGAISPNWNLYTWGSPAWNDPPYDIDGHWPSHLQAMFSGTQYLHGRAFCGLADPGSGTISLTAAFSAGAPPASYAGVYVGFSDGSGSNLVRSYHRTTVNSVVPNKNGIDYLVTGGTMALAWGEKNDYVSGKLYVHLERVGTGGYGAAVSADGLSWTPSNAALSTTFYPENLCYLEWGIYATGSSTMAPVHMRRGIDWIRLNHLFLWA